MSEILFLTHRIPFLPNRGDKIRSHHLLRKLASMGPVHVGCFYERTEDRSSVAALDAITASHCVVQRSKPLVLAGAQAVLSGKPVSLTAFHSAKLSAWVERTLDARPISTIVVFSGQMGQYIPKEFAGRVIIDLCDVDSAKFESYAEAGERVWLNAREGRLLAAEEDRLARLCDATVLISKAEATLFRSRLSDPEAAQVKVIGNGVDASTFDPATVPAHKAMVSDHGPHLVFTGQMDYRPNEAAALWTIEQLLPVIHQRYPSARFHVVGRSPTPALLKHDGGNGVHVWGAVPDVRPFLAGATCVLAPLLIARGVQNKVLEAMAMARPVLLTEQAATGIGASDGEHWMVCRPDLQAMLKRLSQVLDFPEAAAQMGQAARDFVLFEHDWDAVLAPMDALVSGRGLPVATMRARHAA
ncbi:MAG: TIGR03087 family PEP-CTERM/XrtA system glycosyltransferase [Erythrobacter sp.]|uniref:TIGR03087 family PEP-CTERM/XrtA system glycosyltransferase n=1 Tax=Erythrobacter sp. TaxID=1042 RepID=UPI002621D186|nr:TIGR03087 family PEP-CTERM/XrtA system glycosyltransferase [Erythrobacter sp.]MDJ0977849.1 TIGR03087 family PEP-CTERM/XrtA system glycosyltransferase [Erythrobacter sp.]